MLDPMFNKANRKLYLLKRIRPYISSPVASLVYNTHVLPMLDYADFIVESGKMEKVDKLDSIKKSGVRVIDNKNHGNKTFEQLLCHYGIKTLADRRYDPHQVLMYRLSTNMGYTDTYIPAIVLRNNNKI